MRKILTLLIFLLSLGISAKAQGPVYRPGDSIRITVTFDGPDADKLTTANMYLEGPASNLPPGQEGFLAQISTANAQKVAPGKFTISYLIPENLASGEYHLIAITGFIGPIAFTYQATKDFQPKSFKIENSKTYKRPTVKDVQVP